jgi:hypothetical protein
MKKFYMTMVAMLCGVAAMAQNELYMTNVSNVTAGETVDLQICLRNEAAISSVAFKMELPEGFTAPKKAALSFNEERLDLDKARIAAEDEEAELEDLFEFSVTKGLYSFGPSASGYRDDNQNWVSVTFLGNDGLLIVAPVKIASSVADGEYEVKLYDVSLANDEFVAKSVATSSEATCKIGVGVTVGINSINATDSKAPVYNLAGQRVSKTQKGVYIQNGKKVAVK